MQNFWTQRSALVTAAMENNDMTLLDQAMSMTAAEDHEQFCAAIRRVALLTNSIPTLHYLFKRGVSFKHISPSEILGAQNISIPTLEFLLAHDWDINWRGNHAPFLWGVLRDEQMVTWCLEHGASVTPCDEAPFQSALSKFKSWWNGPPPDHGSPQPRTTTPYRCDPILERAAGDASIATFELLRSKGAPIGWATLHRAVEKAAIGHSGEENPMGDIDAERRARARYIQRIGMVRHLIDVVGLDVNGDDQPPGPRKRMHGGWGTPISYIPGSGMPERHFRELTWFLLDRGADPTPALKLAKEFSGYTMFVRDVEAWKAKKESGVR